MSDLSLVLPIDELRAAEIHRSAGRCRWPGCPEWGHELAHLEHRGSGGRLSMNRLDNVAFMCREHHRSFDLALVTPEDYEALLDAVCKDGTSVCVWPGCGDAPVTFRQVEPGVFPLRPYCGLHAPMLDLRRPVHGRRRMMAELLRVIVTR